jgi:bisphosphoglycerate-dependent phosphoglycerate mutase
VNSEAIHSLQKENGFLGWADIILVVAGFEEAVIGGRAGEQ